MERPLLQSALRVLSQTYGGRRLTVVAAADVDAIRAAALPDERDLDLDDLAGAVARRLLREPDLPH